MKRLFAFFLLLSVSGTAQVTVGTRIIEPALKPGKIDKERYTQLKQTRTIFIYRDSDTIDTDVSAFEQMLKDAWTCTKELIPMSASEFKKFEPEGKISDYSFWTISGALKTITSTQTNASGRTTSKDTERMYVFLELSMYDGDEKVEVARVDLHPAYSRMLRSASYIYSGATLYNWFPGYLKNALQQVNSYIGQEKERSYFERGSTDEIAELRSHTLYVPEYTLNYFNKFTGDESRRHDAEELFAAYDYDYKIVPVDQLSEMITGNEKPIYYLSYVKSSTHLFYNVINSKTGEIVYSFYKGNSYNLKKKYFAKLNSAVKKG